MWRRIPPTQWRARDSWSSRCRNALIVLRMKPTLDDLRFDTTGWALHGEDEGTRILRNAAGDQLTANVFRLPPDIPTGLDAIDLVRSFYRAQIAGAGAALVEL